MKILANDNKNVEIFQQCKRINAFVFSVISLVLVLHLCLLLFHCLGTTEKGSLCLHFLAWLFNPVRVVVIFNINCSYIEN